MRQTQLDLFSVMRNTKVEKNTPLSSSHSLHSSSSSSRSEKQRHATPRLFGRTPLFQKTLFSRSSAPSLLLLPYAILKSKGDFFEPVILLFVFYLDGHVIGTHRG